MSLGQFLSILRARWGVAALVLFITVGTTMVISLLLPKQYSATASVVVDMKPDPVAGALYPPGMLAPAYMATQVDVIQSTRVAQRVVRNLKLTESPEVRRQWQEASEGEGDIEQWLVGTFKRLMDVKPSRESNMINVSYRSPDPRFAAALANAFVQAYIDTTLEMRVDPARLYSSFFDVRAKEARETLEKAQARVSAFQRAKGIIATDERLDVENARLNELSTQLVMSQALSAESSSRQAQAQGASSDRMQEVLNNQLVASLTGDLSRAQARLKELGARLGDGHPQVIEAKASIAELRGRIDAETKRVTAGVGVTNSIFRNREAQIRAELEAQRAKVLRMKQVRDESTVYLRDVENAQRVYDALLARLNQASMESLTTQSNIYVLAQAQPPLQASSPKVLLNTLLSIAIGAMLAVGATLVLELLDRRVRALEDVSTALGLPVLGVMPLPAGRRALGGRRIPLMQQRLLGALPSPRKGQ
ncbi:chain length determinant protein EpsF [Piscinibacter sp.]|jgi:chain length determinant protein EpsF|uniref:chain length determinant protein EpsF n=1 Tax=Piscinibacter sp. TaxID=1903157 RepID=UPI002F40219C